MKISTLRLLQYVGIPASAVRCVSFEHARPAYEREYARLLGLTPRFDQPTTGIELDRRALEQSVLARNPELHRLLTAQAETLHARVLAASSYGERVRTELRAALPTLLEMPEVARRLGTSERSLRRRLADEGRSYSQLVEESQIELAHTLLEDPRSTVKEVAHRLGYDSVSGFCRAFRRWTGQRPSSLRSRPRVDPIAQSF